MKKERLRRPKISYEFVPPDIDDGRLDRAFDVLFNIVLRDDLKRKNRVLHNDLTASHACDIVKVESQT